MAKTKQKTTKQVKLKKSKPKSPELPTGDDDDCPLISTCEQCGKEIDENHTYIVSISYPNCRDVCYDFCRSCYYDIERLIHKKTKYYRDR